MDEQGYVITGEKDLGGNGIQLKLSTGTTVNIYKTGTVTVQGKNSESVKKLFGLIASEPIASYKSTTKSNKDEVFFGIRPR